MILFWVLFLEMGEGEGGAMGNYRSCRRCCKLIP